MNKIILFSALFLSFSSFSQQIHKCGTHEAMQYQETLNPGYLQQVNEVFSRAKDHQNQDRSTVYTIPVVVHVVYNNADENIPDSVIFNQIQVLNDSYGYTNPDTLNLRDTFNTIVGTTNIQFELATIGPDGNTTTGITRTQTDITEFGDIGFLTGDMSGVERIKSTANGGEDPWDQSRYLNIWVADMSVLGFTALMGYATPPDGLSNWPAGSTDGMSDGVVVQYQAFGNNNPIPLDPGTGAIDFRGRTCVHEVGHYLGLRHIWGDGDCTQQDGIDDTPNAVENSQTYGCDSLPQNTCVDNIGILGDLPNMYENYMDYSSEHCQVAFTLGQRDLMRGVIETDRWDLIDNYPALTVSENNPLNLNDYPNPSNGNITVSGLKGTNTIEIYANNGQLINNINSTESDISINELPAGIYFIRISNSNGVVTKKLSVIK
ncbi:MAG: zinc-dependent metalloprotease [Vicingaceae bacterium]|nr:zinc-dependent metalloprotease [Vicingaceae bacterium]